MLLHEVAGDGMGAPRHERIASLAVGRVAGVGQIDEALGGQLGAQRLQHAQAANAAVEHADGRIGRRGYRGGRRHAGQTPFRRSSAR